MRNSRSTASKSRTSILAIAIAVLAMLGAGRIAQAEGRKRVVVLDFDGPKGEKFHDDLVRLIKKTHTVVPTDKWNGAASQLDAGAVSDKNIKKVARKLKIDAIVEGKVEKRRDEFIIRLKLRAGRSGQLIGDSIDTKADGPRIDGRAQKDLRDELVGAIDNVESNHSAGDAATEEEDEAPVRAAKKSAKDAKDDDEDKPAAKKPKDLKEARAKEARDAKEAKEAREAKDADDEDDKPRKGFSRRGDDERGSDKIGKARKAEAKDAKDDDEDKPAARKPVVKPADDEDKPAARKAVVADDEDKPTPKKPVRREDDEKPAPPAKKPVVAEADDESAKKPTRRADDARRGKAKRTASRDPDAENDADADRRAPIDSATALLPGERMLDAVVGMSLTMRQLTYTLDPLLRATPPGYKGIAAPGAIVDLTVFPLAFGHTRRDVYKDIGLEVMYDRVLKLTSRLNSKDPGGNGTGLSYDTEEAHWVVAPTFRYSVVSAITLLGSLGYARQRFNILGDVELPDVKYTMWVPRVGARLSIWKLTAGIDGMLMAITDTGEIQQQNQFGAAHMVGYETDASIEYRVTPNIFARGAFRLENISFTFKGTGLQSNARDGMPMTQDVLGARDRYIGGTLTVGYAY
jgi:hypothetical protein